MENNGNKKMRRTMLLRGGLVALAAVMLLCGSYFATMAFLHHKTAKVDNTFFPVGLADSLLIVEKDQADDDGDGIYDEVATGPEVTAESFLIAPGVTLHKRPYVKIDNLYENAYLYISYVDTIHGNEGADKKELPWEIDPANWVQIEDAVHKRIVYAYIGPGSESGILVGSKAGTDYTNLDLLKDDCVKVLPDAYDIRNSTATDYSTSSLIFDVYLAQAMGFDNAQEAWNNTHGQ